MTNADEGRVADGEGDSDMIAGSTPASGPCVVCGVERPLLGWGTLHRGVDASADGDGATGEEGLHPYAPVSHFLSWSCERCAATLYAYKLAGNLQICTRCGLMYCVTHVGDTWSGTALF